MIENKIKNNPDFTEDETVGEDKEEKETVVEETAEETTTPSEASTEEQGGDKEEETPEELTQKELDGLDGQKGKLEGENKILSDKIITRKGEIIEQRRQRRENRETLEGLDKTEEGASDDLSDVDPADVKRLERVLKAKGYKTESEFQTKSLKEAQEAAEDDFYEAHPEYSPENDDGDTLYNALGREINSGVYAKPTNARQYKTILEKAHKEISSRFPDKFKTKTSSPAITAAQKQKLKTAGAGAGNQGSSTDTQKSSTLTDTQKQHLRDGGFSEDEIAEM